MERRMCADEEVAVVGGANSAGQAAVFLAETAKRVHMLIRSDGLSSTMSRYLISRIDAHPRIEQHARTEIVGLEGNGHLERVSWRTGPGGPVRSEEHTSELQSRLHLVCRLLLEKKKKKKL